MPASNASDHKRHFGRLGAALLSASLMLPIGCAKKAEKPVELEKPQTTVGIVHLSAPLCTLIERTERGRPFTYHGHRTQSYRQWVERSSGDEPGNPGLDHALSLKGWQSSKKTVYKDVDSVFMNFSTVDLGYTATVRVSVRGDSIYPFEGFRSLLRRATQQPLRGVKLVLDYDTVSAHLAVIALPMGEASVQRVKGTEGAATYGIIGKYKGGYLAAGWIFDHFTQADSAVGRAPDNSIAKNSRVSEFYLGPLLFLVEPGVPVSDLSDLGAAATRCISPNRLSQMLATDTIIFTETGHTASTDQYTRDYEAQMHRQQQLDDDHAHGLGTRW